MTLTETEAGKRTERAVASAQPTETITLHGTPLTRRRGLVISSVVARVAHRLSRRRREAQAQAVPSRVPLSAVTTHNKLVLALVPLRSLATPRTQASHRRYRGAREPESGRAKLRQPHRHNPVPQASPPSTHMPISTPISHMPQHHRRFTAPLMELVHASLSLAAPRTHNTLRPIVPRAPSSHALRAFAPCSRAARRCKRFSTARSHGAAVPQAEARRAGANRGGQGRTYGTRARHSGTRSRRDQR